MLIADAKAAADKIAREVSKAGPIALSSVTPFAFIQVANHRSYSEGKVIEALQSFATNKTSGSDRESAAIAFNSIATICGPSYTPFLLPSLPIIFDLYMDKGDVVRTAASTAVKSILKSVPPESTRIIFAQLEEILEAGKWRTKVGVLNSLKTFVAPAPTQVAEILGDLLPKVEKAMHDTKSDVRFFTLFCGCSFADRIGLIGLIGGDQMRYVPLYNTCQS